MVIDKLLGGILNRGQPNMGRQANMGGQLNMGNPYGGMLTREQQQYANRQGAITGAARGLQMSGPSRMPISTGQIMGGILGAALPARQQAQTAGVQARGIKQQLTRGKQEIDLGKLKLQLGADTIAARRKLLGEYNGDPMKALEAGDFRLVELTYPDLLKRYHAEQVKTPTAFWGYDTETEATTRITDADIKRAPGRYVQKEPDDEDYLWVWDNEAGASVRRTDEQIAQAPDRFVKEDPEDNYVWAYDTVNKIGVRKTDAEIRASDGQFTQKAPTDPDRRWAYDPASKQVVFATDKEITEGGMTKPPSGMEFRLNADGTFEFSSTGEGLGRRAIGQAETDIMSSDITLARLSDLREGYDRRYLTIGGNLEEWAGNAWNRVNPEYVNEFAAEAAAWKSSVNQYFIDYKKWATGVAAGPVEMAMIRDSIPNTEDGPAQFEAKMTRLVRLTRRLNVRRLMALQKGLDILVESEEGMKFFGDNPLNSIPTRQERGEALERYYQEVGVPPNQIQQKVVQKMIEEGYGQ